MGSQLSRLRNAATADGNRGLVTTVLPWAIIAFYVAGQLWKQRNGGNGGGAGGTVSRPALQDQTRSGAAAAAAAPAAPASGSGRGAVAGSRSDPVETAMPSTGYELLRSPRWNLGLAFAVKERERLGLCGLLPPAQLDLDEQVQRVMEQIRSKATPLDKYIYLQTLQDTNETLYYATLIEFTHEVMPICYTPVVGQACQEFSHIYRQTPRGLYISLHDRGRIRQVLDNWPEKNVKAIVFTDGERILGLGDQGVNGMGIPIGKLALYTACGGVPPYECLPITLDVGTNNEKNLSDPYYMGLKQHRLTGREYDDFVAEFMEAAIDAYGANVMLQFEDFGNTNAFRLLHTWQSRCCTFNDDIQGTASVVLGGLLASERLTNRPLKDHVFLFLGAGEAGVGIADLIAVAVNRQNPEISVEEARKKIWLVDSRGLVVASRRESLQHHKLAYAHEGEFQPTLLDAINMLRPTAIIGVSAQPRTFTEDVCRRMATLNETPLIFALSNPTSKAECTAEQAYTWTDGRCVYASGSPFDPVTLPDGRTIVPGQGNNAYIFPGIGLGAVAVGCTRIDNEDMYIAACALAEQVTQDRVDVGCIYPPLDQIRRVSAHIAAAVAENAYSRGTASLSPRPADLLAHAYDYMYSPCGRDGE